MMMHGLANFKSVTAVQTTQKITDRSVPDRMTTAGFFLVSFFYLRYKTET